MALKNISAVTLKFVGEKKIQEAGYEIQDAGFRMQELYPDLNVVKIQ